MTKLDISSQLWLIEMLGDIRLFLGILKHDIIGNK